MSKTDDNGNGNGGTAEAIKVPMLQIVFDPRTYNVAVSGNTPTLEFSKAMLQMAADEIERQIQDRRAQGRVAIATADIFTHLPKG